jgi:Putative peptidoglycan binding domain
MDSIQPRRDMIDIRGATAKITHVFDLESSRAIQTAAQDPITDQWYVSQGSGSGSGEDTVITRCAVRDSKGKCKRISKMVLTNAGHPSTISVLRRGTVLGILVNWSGDLGWVPYKAGTFKTKTSAGFQPLFTSYGEFAYIDHDSDTIAFRSGSTIKLYHLIEDKLGVQIGKTIKTTNLSGPQQGFFTGKFNADYVVFNLTGYGHPHQKQYCEVISFLTGQRYTTTVRTLGKTYLLQEPEFGFVKGGDIWIGYSSRRVTKQPVAAKLSLKPTAPVKPTIIASKVKFGVTSPEIRKLQLALNKAGFTTLADGNYGKQTRESVRAYQTKKKLYIDGIAGPVTLASLGFNVK